MDCVERLELIKVFINQELKRLGDLLSSVDCTLSELQTRDCESEELVRAIIKLLSSSSSVENANKLFSRDLSDVLSIFKPRVQWHPNQKDNLEMYYLSGNSPWSIWLSYDPTTEIDRLYKNLEQRHAKGLLKKLKNPHVGDFICCYDKKIIFRALIIDISNTRIKVINVDRYNVKLTKLDACYEMEKDFFSIHAHSIQCCLTMDKKNEKLWNDDLGQLFQNVLKECRLTVRLAEEINQIPPLFVVEMYAFNEALEVETNISHWITKRLFPELESLPENMSDNVLDHFSDEALDPFLVFSNLLRSTSETSSLELDTENSNMLQLAANGSVDYVFSAVNNLTLEEKPRNRLAHLVTPKPLSPDPDVFISGDSNIQLSDHSIKNLPITQGSSSKGFTHCELPCKEISQISPSECANNNEVYDNLVREYCKEDSVIPSNYVPTDEKRICAFYANKGYCWKPGCNKEHVKIQIDRWTSDSVELYKDTLNTLSLPLVGSKVTLKVSFVVTSNIFYALLPDVFSDTGEGSETATLLNRSLNSVEGKKNFKLLMTPPCLGEIIIAYSSAKSLWLRGAVHDVYDKDNLQVFFIDDGRTEEVPLQNCREIDPQYLHLPSQAVHCTLAEVFFNDSNEKEAKLFLQSLILDKEIEAQIIDCDSVDNRLEVIAFVDGTNVNELMRSKSFFLEQQL